MENTNDFFKEKVRQIQINNKTIIEFGSHNTNLCLNNSSYPTQPHSIIV